MKGVMNLRHVTSPEVLTAMMVEELVKHLKETNIYRSNYHFFFDSVEAPFTWKLSPAPLLYSQRIHFSTRVFNENEPGCSGSGRCFSRPYF